MKKLVGTLFFAALTLKTAAQVQFEWVQAPPTLIACGNPYMVRVDGYNPDAPSEFVFAGIYKNGACVAVGSGWGDASAQFYDNNGGLGVWYATFENNSGILAELTQQTDCEYVPRQLVASNLTRTSLKLAWQVTPPDPGAVYDVVCNNVFVGTTSLQEMIVTGLQAGNTYVLKVGAGGAWSNPLSVHLQDTTPPTAFILQAPTHTATSVTISWNASTDVNGVVGYDVYMTNGVGTTLVRRLGSSELTITLQRHPGTTFQYYVKARDGFENVAVSNTVTSSTPASPDSDGDGVPNQLESLFNSSNPTADPTLNLKIYSPNRP